MYIPQRFESAHGTGQRMLLFIVIAPGIPQLAIAKTKSALRFRNSFRQFGRVRLEEGSKIQVPPSSFRLVVPNLLPCSSPLTRTL